MEALVLSAGYILIINAVLLMPAVVMSEAGIHHYSRQYLTIADLFGVYFQLMVLLVYIAVSFYFGLTIVL